MQYVTRIGIALILALVFSSALSAADLSRYVTVRVQYLTDSANVSYGAEYYVSSSYNERVCFYARVVELKNATGTVSNDKKPRLLDPREQNVKFGSFRANNNDEWLVRIQTKSEDDCY